MQQTPLYDWLGFAPWDLSTIAIGVESLIFTCELLDTIHLFLADPPLRPMHSRLTFICFAHSTTRMSFIVGLMPCHFFDLQMLLL